MTSHTLPALGGTLATLALSLIASMATAQTWDIGGNPVTGDSYLGTTTPYGLTLGTNKAEWMRITSAGNIGINTETPSTRLEIVNGILKLTGPTEAGGPMIMFKGAVNSSYTADWGIEYIPADQGRPGLNFWRPFDVAGGGNHFLFLADNGNVGIRTDEPKASFTVNGNMLIGDPASVNLPTGYRLFVQTGILTERVKVALVGSQDWPDYVFSDNYHLMSPDSLASYISSHHHLPNIPSETEIQADGMDLGEMNIKLLRQIEELTLRVIELNKRINQLEQENDAR